MTAVLTHLGTQAPTGNRAALGINIAAAPAGAVLIAIVRTQKQVSSAAPAPTVTDDKGNVWTRKTGYTYGTGAGNNLAVHIYYLKLDAGIQIPTSVTATGSVSMSTFFLTILSVTGIIGTGAAIFDDTGSANNTGAGNSTINVVSFNATAKNTIAVFGYIQEDQGDPQRNLTSPSDFTGVITQQPRLNGSGCIGEIDYRINSGPEATTTASWGPQSFSSGTLAFAFHLNGVPAFVDATEVTLVTGTTPFLAFYNQNREPLPDADVMPTAIVTAAAFSPDGNTLIVAQTATPFIRIYSMTTGSPVYQGTVNSPPTYSEIDGIAFNADGSRFAVADATQNRIDVYNAATKNLVASPQSPAGGAPRALAWGLAPFLVAGFDAAPYLRLYDNTTFAQITNPAVMPTAEIVAVGVSADGLAFAALQQTDAQLFLYRSSDKTRITTAATGGTNTSILTALLSFGVGGRLAVGHNQTPYLATYSFDVAAMTSSKNTSPAVVPAGTTRTIGYTSDGKRLYVSGNYATPLTSYSTPTSTSTPVKESAIGAQPPQALFGFASKVATVYVPPVPAARPLANMMM